MQQFDAQQPPPPRSVGQVRDILKPFKVVFSLEQEFGGRITSLQVRGNYLSSEAVVALGECLTVYDGAAQRLRAADQATPTVYVREPETGERIETADPSQRSGAYYDADADCKLIGQELEPLGSIEELRAVSSDPLAQAHRQISWLNGEVSLMPSEAQLELAYFLRGCLSELFKGKRTMPPCKVEVTFLGAQGTRELADVEVRVHYGYGVARDSFDAERYLSLVAAGQHYVRLPLLKNNPGPLRVQAPSRVEEPLPAPSSEVVAGQSSSQGCSNATWALLGVGALATSLFLGLLGSRDWQLDSTPDETEEWLTWGLLVVMIIVVVALAWPKGAQQNSRTLPMEFEAPRREDVFTPDELGTIAVVRAAAKRLGSVHGGQTQEDDDSQGVNKDPANSNDDDSVVSDLEPPHEDRSAPEQPGGCESGDFEGIPGLYTTL